MYTVFVNGNEIRFIDENRALRVVIGGMCLGNDRLKMRPLKNYKKIYGDFIDIVGIAVDEEEALENIIETITNKSATERLKERNNDRD